MASDTYQPTQIFDVTIHSVCKSPKKSHLATFNFGVNNGDISGDLQALWTLLRECLEVITKKSTKGNYIQTTYNVTIFFSFSFSAAILILATKAFFEISAMHFICSGMNHLSMCSFQRCQKLIGPAVLCL